MAKLVNFRAEYGTSVEIKGAWHKFSCAAEVEFSEGDNISEVKERVWNTVVVEIEKQVQELLG